MATVAGRTAHRAAVGLAGAPASLSSRSPQLIGVIAQARCMSTGYSYAASRQKSVQGAWKGPQFRSRPRRLNNLVSQSRYNSNVASEIPAATATAAEAGTSNLPPPRRHVLVRLLATFGLFCVFTPIGFYLSAGPLAQTLKEMESIPTDAETLALVDPRPNDFAYEVNQNILNNPLAKALFANEKFSASRPHLKIPPSLRNQSFTAGTLVGPNMLPVPPLVFSTKEGTELVQILYVGTSLCGHPGLVHGGMLATLLDEGLARCCFPGLPNKVGVTASLKIDYRTPCKADQYVVLKAETTKFDGRKAWVKGRLETLPLDGSPGQLITEAEALFIEPRNAALLARQRKVVGGDGA